MSGLRLGLPVAVAVLAADQASKWWILDILRLPEIRNVPVLALGPAATVLAARLTRLGYWALDIGHISQAYQTVVHGAPRAETTPFVTPG